ncbi:MAG: ribosome maturation factor RimM [Clostridiales Family XIII bacterium]|nr:ribosome maturation factor RimM [Clostridiales Family XIII bacterium]
MNKKSGKDEKIHIGRIAGVFGLKGELKLFHCSGERERISGIKELFLRSGADERRAEVESLRYSGKIPIVKLAGTDDRNAAERLVGFDVFALSDSLSPLQDGQYYVTDLIGLRVEDEQRGDVGRVIGVIDNPAHDILRVANEKGEWLLPLVDVFVSGIDTESGRIGVNVPNGLIED